MDKEDITFFKKWFSEYVATHLTDDPAENETIRLKEEHTWRVCEEIVKIGQAMNLSEHQLMLAETMALFHDIGRFQQYAVYGTFQDAVSENHAGLGLKEMAREDILSRCPSFERAVINKVIGYHNMYSLPEDEDEYILFFARLLRDADKLDIWQIFIDYYAGQYNQTSSTILWGLPDNPTYCSVILKALRAKTMADTKEMTTVNDFKLLQISWVFDVNFTPTFQTVFERKYVEKLAAALPRSKEIEELVAMVVSYVQNHIKLSSCE